MKRNIKKAFSLVEISIVIVIIGVLIAGISKGVDLYVSYRLTSAQNLTRNSVVNRLEDLVAWYETSLPSSFNSDQAKVNNGPISIWNDNSQLSLSKNNAISSGSYPILVKNALNNSIPALKFSGTQDLNFDGTSLAKSAYTIFVVEGVSGSIGYFISGQVHVSDRQLHIGYRNSNTITLAHYANDVNFDVSSYYSPSINKIHRFAFNTNNGKSYALNGVNFVGVPFVGDELTNLQPLVEFYEARIGGQYVGNIAEIIIFKKALKNEEIKAVESYLGAKYGIKI